MLHSALVHQLRARGIAAVGVGFPATPILASRVRFCISSAHTREMLDHVLDAVDEVADILRLRLSQRVPRPLPPPSPKSAADPIRFVGSLAVNATRFVATYRSAA